jgi:anti-sigma factor (TIGR02949 family)
MDTPTHIDCREVVRRLDDYLDRELGREEIEVVSAHLERCTHCAGAYALEAGLLAELKVKLRRIAAPPDLLRRILARLEREPGPPAGSA